MSQSGNGSPIQITIQPEQGQNSGASQYLVTLTSPAAAAQQETQAAAAAAVPAAMSSLVAASAAIPAAQATTTSISGMTVTTLQEQMQSLESSWSTLTPQQVAFQLATASGTGGGAPTATVPGTTMTFGDLNQAQQLAYQYGTDYGTGGVSMQQFLNANAGPDTPWNLSYNQIQSNPEILAAANNSNSDPASGTAGLSADNLPNPALIQYLPQSQQAAAEAAVAAEGAYGTNITAAVQAYESAMQSA